MTAIREWISPLPDKSLPALRIREELLRILMEVRGCGGRGVFGSGRNQVLIVCLCACVCVQLPSVSQETLKHSGIGRAVMFLYKHPKESRSNKDLALKLISEAPPTSSPSWPRPTLTLTLCVYVRVTLRRVVAAHFRPHFQLQGDDEGGAAAEGPGAADASEAAPQVRLHPLLTTHTCAHFLLLPPSLPFTLPPPTSTPQKVEWAEEPDVFSPPSRFGLSMAWRSLL